MWPHVPPPLLDRWTRLRKQARHQGLSKPACQRLEWLIHYFTHGENALGTSRHFGIAPKTFWKWKGRFEEDRLSRLEGQSTAPIHRRTRQRTPEQEARIIALRQEFLRYGKEKLALKYAARHGEPISAWQVQKVIEAHQLYFHPAKNARTQKKRLRAQTKKRITELTVQPQTFFLFKLDTIVRYWAGTKRYILTAIDTVSRLAFAHMYTTHSSRSAADFLQRLVLLTDHQVTKVHTDNGSEFHKEFETACQALHVEHYWSRVRTPKDNAHNERFNRTLQEEFIELGHAITDPMLFNAKLTLWLIEYNFYRPHQALGYLTPMCLIQRHGHLLPMSPSSTNP